MNVFGNKRGLSGVIVTLILILLVLVAVGVVWVVVQNILESGTERISLSQLTISMDVDSVNVEDNGDVKVTVRRNAGEGELTGVNLIVSDGQNEEVVERTGSIDELEARTYTITQSELGSVKLVNSVSISPILNINDQERISNPIDSYDLTGNSWETVLDWNREENGDTLSDFESLMTQEVFQSMCEWENNGDMIRWSEAGSSCESGEAMMRWSKEFNQPNKGEAQLKLHFDGISYESSGVSFYVEDVAENKYQIKCDEDSETPDEGISCDQQDAGSSGGDPNTFTWDDTYTIEADSGIKKFYIASEMDDCCFDGGDSSDLYRFELSLR